MLRHIKDRHCDVERVGYDKHRNKGFEYPLKEHECFYVVHIVLFRYHADKLVA